MSGEIPERVTCKVCGTAFDPRKSRGWCPNSACGKWQHPAFPLSEGGSGTQEAADGGVDAPMKACPSCGKEVRADANFCKFCSHQFPDEPAEQAGSGESATGLDECPDCGADLSSIPPDRLDDCPICGTNLAEILADQSEPSVTPADLEDCPACGEDLTGIPADMRMVCPGCRVDLQEAIETHGVDDEPGDETPPDQPSETGTADQAGADAAEAGSEADAATPEATTDDADADADVDTIKGIGTSYAERLADAGVETVGDLVAADVSTLSAATDISESRIEAWVENAPIDPADIGTAEPDVEDEAGVIDEGGARSSGQQAGQPAGGQQRSGQPSGQQEGRHSASGPTGGGSQRDRQEGQAGGGRRSARGDVDVGGQPGRTGEQGEPDPDRVETQVQPRYDTVVLEVMGQEIRARPGDTVGQEIRTAMVEGGSPDTDAVYVHREHIRVEREGDTFYFVRLGQNSLKINGEPVGQYERAEVSTGDVASFSEVVTADIRLE